MNANMADAMSAALARNWWAIVIREVPGIVVELIALLLPAATMLGLVLLFAACMLVDGVFSVAAARAARRRERGGLLVLEGIADLAAGVTTVLWPEITVLALLSCCGSGAIAGCIRRRFEERRHECARWNPGAAPIAESAASANTIRDRRARTTGHGTDRRKPGRKFDGKLSCQRPSELDRHNGNWLAAAGIGKGGSS